MNDADQLCPAQGTPGRASALALHRGGRLTEARAAYEALLAAWPEDADLLGLLGVVAMQEGRAAAAHELFSRALAAPGDPRIQLRNLNNYLVLLGTETRGDDARALVACGIPDWPEGAVPDAAERSTVVSLAEALLRLGRPEAGLRLLDRALPGAAGGAEALLLRGRLRVATGEPVPALGDFAGAAERMPGDPRPLAGRAAALARTGDDAAARAAARDLAVRFPFHAEPRRPGQRATILVLNPAPERIEDPGLTLQRLHFSVNYPAQFVTQLAGDYRFLSLLDGAPAGAAHWRAEGAELVINNLVNAEALNVPGRAAAAQALAARTGLPVINHPAQAARTTRQLNAEALAGLPGVVVPRITRYRPADTPVDAIVADIGRRFPYPVILRTTGGHMGSNSVLPGEQRTVRLAADARELRETLATSGWPEFYAIEYVDLCKPEGWWRKIRAAVVGDEIVLVSGGFFDHWLTVGWRGRGPGIEFYRRNPEALQRARAFLANPERELGTAALAALERIRTRIPLDLFGIDFDVDDEGRVVFFEATGASIFMHPTEGIARDLWLPEEPYRRLHAAFHRLVARRIGGTG